MLADLLTDEIVLRATMKCCSDVDHRSLVSRIGRFGGSEFAKIYPEWLRKTAQCECWRECGRSLLVDFTRCLIPLYRTSSNNNDQTSCGTVSQPPVDLPS